MLPDDEIERVYEKIRWRIDKVNADYLKKIGDQIKKIGKLNPSSINRIAQMRIYGANTRKINQELAKAMDVSAQEVQELLEKAVEEEYTSAAFLAVERGRSVVPLKFNYSLQRFAQSIAAQTANSMLNYSNSTNMDVAYQEVVSDAIDAVSRGVTDYHSAIRDSLRKLGGDGLRVTYESGYTRRLDTAIRQNILDGTKQIAMQAQKQIGQQIGADGVELSAHPYSALDHEPAQGRQYSLAAFDHMQRGEAFEDVDGNRYDGFQRPIGEWNCRHFPSYIVLGVSPRRYTDEQLRQWKEQNHRGCEIDGKHYTVYQASQLMRKLETKVRQQKDIANLAKASGDDVLRREAQAKIRDLKAKYAEVSEKSGLRQRTDKMIVETLPKEAKHDIIEVQKGGGISVDMHIDKFTPCLEDTKSGQLVQTKYTIATVEDLRALNGWKFDWLSPELHKADIYKLTVDGDNKIQGLIACTPFHRDHAIYVNLVESAPHNIGSNKQYNGVGGHLFAIAAQKSIDNGYGGFLFWDAKNKELVEHYQTVLGAHLLGMPHPYRMFLDEKNAAKLVDTYTLEEGL